MKFYFDFLSPYSYLAWQWLKESRSELREQDIEIILIPVVLGQIIGHYETKGPAQITPKRNYLFKDCLRYSQSKNISFTTPKSLPFNSLYALRLTLALENDKDSQFDFVDAVFTKGWARGEEIGESESMEEILSDLNLDQSLMDKTGDREVRKQLKLNVKDALNNGVFGVPTFIYKDELFWGNDSIKYLNLFIKGKDPLSSEKYNNFLEKHPFN